MGERLRPSVAKKRKLKYISKAKKKQYNNDVDTLTPEEVKIYSCYKKKRHNGTAEVIYAGRTAMRFEPEKKLFYYKCPNCKGYHLTHRPGGSSVEIKKLEG